MLLQKFVKGIVNLTFLIVGLGIAQNQTHLIHLSDIGKGLYSEEISSEIIPKSTATITDTIKKIDLTQLNCLAKNIYFEAAGEPFLGQVAVARVVMNRIQYGFANTPCKVVYQSYYVQKETEEGTTEKIKLCQFSWTCDNKKDPHKNNPSYIRAKQIAYDVLANDAYKNVISKSTVYFHSINIEPKWPYQKTKQIGNHVFYSKYKKKPNKSKVIIHEKR